MQGLNDSGAPWGICSTLAHSGKRFQNPCQVWGGKISWSPKEAFRRFPAADRAKSPLHCPPRRSRLLRNWWVQSLAGPFSPLTARKGSDPGDSESPQGSGGSGAARGRTEVGSGNLFISSRFPCLGLGRPRPSPPGPLPRGPRYQLLMKNCSSSIQEAAKEESAPGAALG